VVFTSTEMLTSHMGEGVPATWIKFTQLIHAWPHETLSFAVNPGTPIGATLPGGQIVALASWADEVGLTDEPPEQAAPATEAEPAERSVPPQQTGPIVMQKTISGQQVPYYLDRGYDRVSGFVHRATEVSHLRTPAELYNALGLSYSDSPFKPDDAEVYVLRWAAHRGNLYRIPYGGQHEAAMHAMQGWVIERSPFRGNGFAPSESRDVIAEFKVDSVRLPHGAELWRVDRDGNGKLVAKFDADGPRWERVGDES
jgi:YD repeat-containing protein